MKNFLRILGTKAGMSLPINSTVAFVIAIMAAVVFLAVVLPLISNQEGTTGCVGPFKAVASVIADMSETNLCG